MTVTKFNKMGFRCPICGSCVEMHHDQIDYKDGTVPIDFGYFVGCETYYNGDGIHDINNKPRFMLLASPDQAYLKWLEFEEMIGVESEP